MPWKSQVQNITVLSRMNSHFGNKMADDEHHVLDLASPVLISDRPKESKPKTGRGRKRKYVEKYASVEYILRKTIKLDTLVHERWQELRGELSHNEFATKLMDLFESTKTPCDCQRHSFVSKATQSSILVQATSCCGGDMPDPPLTSPNPLQSLTTSCDETSINIFENHTENKNKKEDALSADGDEQSTENLFILLIEESGVKEENTLSNEDKIDIESSAEEKGGKKVFMNEKAKESYLRYKSLRPDVSDGLAKSKYDTATHVSMDECVLNEVGINSSSELQSARLPTIQSNDALVNPVNCETYTNVSNDNSSCMNIQTNPACGIQDSNSPETHNSLFKNVESYTNITANLLMGECSSKDSEVPPSASPPSPPSPPSAPLSVRNLSSTPNICTDSLFKDLNLENYSNITNIDRFIVDSNVLFSLFQKCRTPGCGASAIIVKKKTRGAVLCVNVKCSSGHFFEWSSSGESRGLYSTNLLLSAATVLSGNLHRRLEQFLKYIKVKYVTARYTQLIERRYLTPSIDDFYNRIKSDVLINPEKSMFKFSSNVPCDNRSKVAEIDRYFQFDPKSLIRAKRAPRNSLKGKKKKKKAKKKKDYWYIPYFLARILYQREVDTSRLASKERPTFVEDMR